MFIRLIGTVGAGADEASVRAAPGIVAAGVLARIALAGGRVVPTESVIADQWDDPPPTARNAIQVAVSKLRDTYGRHSIETAGGGYRLNDPLARVDALEIEDHVASAHRFALASRWSDVLRSCDAVVALDGGSPLPGLESIWAEERRARISDLLFDAALLRAQSLAAHARITEAAQALAALTAERPFDERAPTALMRTLASMSRVSDALEVYDELRHRLADALGADPAPQTQAVFAELLAGAPATPVVSSIVVRVPQPAGPTFGRAADTQTTVEALRAGSRLVTITGPGGIGKTRVAVGAAREFSKLASASAWFIDLTATAGPEDVAPLLDATIGGGIGSDHVHVLGSGRHLVVLDNAEQIVDEVARTAVELIATGDVSVLVTSRTPLRLTEERLIWLGPLDTAGTDSPAAQLAILRASSWMTPTPDDVIVLAALAERVEGVPLAIELLAASLRWASPSQLLEDVHTQLGHAEVDDRRPERHTSLVAVIDWGVRSASFDARRALAGLGVFGGDFTMSAAEAVCSALEPSVAVRYALSELIDLSLVQRVPGAGEVRLRVLESIRIAASGHPLVGDPPDESVVGFARHYLERVREAVDTASGRDAGLIQLYGRDDHHIARALEYAWDRDADAAWDALGHVLYYWYATMRSDQIELWKERSRERAAEVSAASARRAIALFSWHMEAGRRVELEPLREAIIERRALLDTGWTHRWVKSEASRLLRAGKEEEAIAVRRDGPTPVTPNDIASQALFEALVASGRGDFRRALDLHEQIITDRLWEGVATGHFYVLANAGYFAVVVGDLDRAEELLAEASAVAAATGLRDEIVMARINRGWLCLARDDGAGALSDAAAAAAALSSDDEQEFAAEITVVAALAAEKTDADLARTLVPAVRAAVGADPGDMFDGWITGHVSELLSRWPQGNARALTVTELESLLAAGGANIRA